MTRLILCCTFGLFAFPTFAQTPPTAPPPVPPTPPAQAAQAPDTPVVEEEEGPVLPDVMVSGGFTSEVQAISNPSNSSKFTEYRDLRNGILASRATFFVNDRRNGWFFDFSGTNLSRDDQAILADGGRPGHWSFVGTWSGIPHNFSNRALTPYIERQPGVLQVPATIPITFKKLGTAGADTAGVLASDVLTAAYQTAFLQATPLRTQTNVGRYSAAWSATEALRLSAAYNRRDKTGQKAAFGPIGDRPPRTLNIELAEPVDYETTDITLSAEYDGRGYDARGEYLFSNFENRIDTLRWQNVYATAPGGATFDTWDRLVATYGARPLAPDNQYHNVMVDVGVETPADGRLMGSAGFGRLEQNQALMPYAYHSTSLANSTLPRETAQALMRTMNLSADYVVSPVDRLILRGFFRRFDLTNDTPSSRWQYVTSDTSNLNGAVSYVNKRVSLPYAWDRRNGGVDATVRVPGRLHATFTAGVERESIVRDHREANTGENILRASVRVRPSGLFSMQARYLFGVRDGGTYDGQVTREGYWYTAAEANDFNNPQFTFDNHPDMRRFDVSDRQRRQADLTVNVAPTESLALSGFLRYRHDDFASDVSATQPLLGSGFADQAASTPGVQLGRLDDKRLQSGLDLFGETGARITFNAFLSYDRGTGLQRGIEFNENNKANPSAIATASLGPWTRVTNEWTAGLRDHTWAAGLGGTLIVFGHATLTANYTRSLATIDITYDGFGVTNFNGSPFPPTNEFAFSTPPAVRERLHLSELRFDLPIESVTIVASYRYENYHLEDWQQSGSAPWVESVGSGTLLRDSSRSNQWGNRLFNFGTYLAPDYAAHVAYLGFRFRF